MKLDAFDQYIHDQYQGYEVTPPAAMEQAVMGKLRRMKWARRLRVSGLVLAVAAGGGWWWGFQPEAPVEAADRAVVAPVERVESPVATVPLEVPVAAPAEPAAELPSEVQSVAAEASQVRPAALEPLKARHEVRPLAKADLPEKTLQRDQAGSELWIISAEVEVEDR